MDQTEKIWTTIREALVLGNRGYSASGRDSVSEARFKSQITAPEFPKGLEWINTDKPLTLSELSGKIVILDFWTYC